MVDGNAKRSVVEEDGRVVGMREVQSKRPKSEQARIGDLGMVFINGYRGRGIGKGLMKSIIELCRGQLEFLSLSVLTINCRAVELYWKMGFVESRQPPRGLKRKGKFYSEIIMNLEL